MATETLNKKDITDLHGSYQTDDGNITLFKLDQAPSKGVYKVSDNKVQVYNAFGQGVFNFEFGNDHTKAHFAHCDVKAAQLDGNIACRDFEYINVEDGDDAKPKMVYNAVLTGKWTVYTNKDINGELYFECADQDWLSHIVAFDEHGDKVNFN